ncbi:MAG TPA: M28 family peptidase [Cyclobacteriaceae bacterium]
MNKYLLTSLFVLYFVYLSGQDKKAIKYSKSITKKDLYDRLAILTSDSLEGRETGTIGQKKAARYIRRQFEDVGLKPLNGSYYQRFNLYASTSKEVYVAIDEKKIKEWTEMFSIGITNTPKEKEDTITFLGYGDLKNYEDMNVEGEAVAILNPNNTRNWRMLVDNANTSGANAIFLFVEFNKDEFLKKQKLYKRYLSKPQLSLSRPKSEGETNVFFLPPEYLTEIFDMPYDSLLAVSEYFDNLKEPIKSKIKYKAERSIDTLETENVMGYLEGTKHENEFIVITSHYDHLGKNDTIIYNGADDDGSGTSAVIELAEAFAEVKAKHRDRSILFLSFTGEEKGLLGSEYFSNNPTLPMNQIVTNLNIDMVGRVDDNYADTAEYVYLIGSDKLSSDLHNLSEAVNKMYTNLILDYKYNDENDPNRFYYRSDHYNFARKGIPIIFYFNGVHEDYHRPTDTIEKINFDLLKKRTRLIFFTTWHLMNRKESVQVDN